MKPLHFLLIALTSLSLTACGVTPPTPAETPTTPAVQEKTSPDGSYDILDLNMKEAQLDLDKVE